MNKSEVMRIMRTIHPDNFNTEFTKIFIEVEVDNHQTHVSILKPEDWLLIPMDEIRDRIK